MDERLETVATYWSSVEAGLARNHLMDAGIWSVLSGEETVGMVWHLANAVGGIRLQVRESDAERAFRLLEGIGPGEADREPDEEASEGSEEETPSDSSDEGDLPIHSDAHDGTSPSAEETEYDRPRTRREQDAQRAFRTAVLGLLFLPIQLYAFWLLMRVYISEESLAPDSRSAAVWAAMINFPLMFLFCFFLRTLLSS